MRRSLLLTVSVAVNLVFAAMLTYFARHQGRAAIPALADASGGTNVRPKVQYVVRKQFFNWNQVESPDYPVYIARLREIGCPEDTIHDIVIADVNKLYASKRLDEVPGPQQEWWRSSPDTNLVAAAAAKSAQLDQERRALLTTLLGANWAASESAHTSLALNGPVLGDLSPDTRQAVRDAVAKSQERTRAYLAGLAAGKSPDPADMARLELQMRTDLSKIMTPAQLEEFLLRYSATADSLRHQLRGYDVTADEFRSIFRLQDPIIQQMALGSGPNDSAVEQAAQQKELSDAIKNILGQDRWQAVQQNQDPAYQDAVAVGTQYDAPPEVVQALYRLNLAASKLRTQINSDSTLSPEQKSDQLQALAAQEQSDGDQLLGVTPPNQQPAAPAPPPPPMINHNFSPGETLDQIAARYGVTSADIINANPTLNLNVLSSGTQIRVPVKQ